MRYLYVNSTALPITTSGVVILPGASAVFTTQQEAPGLVCVRAWSVDGGGSGGGIADTTSSSAQVRVAGAWVPGYSKTEIDGLLAALGGGFSFGGYVSPTAPTGDTRVGALWYEATATGAPDKDFPWQVHRYDGSAWSATTEAYSPGIDGGTIDVWSVLDSTGAQVWIGYYAGEEWSPLGGGSVLPDGSTIVLTDDGKIAVAPSLVAEIDAKMNRPTQAYKVVRTNTSGGVITEEALTCAYTTTGAYEVPQRDANGQILVPTAPTANGHAASKAYVDGQLSTKLGSSDSTAKDVIIAGSLPATVAAGQVVLVAQGA